MIRKAITLASKIVVGTIYLMVAITVSITVLPFVMGHKPVIVLSGSMEPVYPVGSMIYYKSSDFEDIKEGDVITFRLGGGTLATHRVIRKDDENQEFITKGDNNQSEDVEPVSYEAVAGKTQKVVIPYVGFIGQYIKEIPIMVALGGLLIVCSMLIPAKDTRRAYASSKKTSL